MTNSVKKKNSLLSPSPPAIALGLRARLTLWRWSLFIFALQYGVAVEGTAAATLVSTVLSLLTLSVLLFLLL